MTAVVFWADSAGNELATVSNTFSASGTPADPTAVSLAVTAPDATQVTYAYNPGTIVKDGTGKYHQDVPAKLEGLYSYVWVGTGTASDVVAGTFTVTPTTVGRWYTSAEEMKDRLGITDTASDQQILLAVQGAARYIEGYTGRYFWQGADTRTYVPYNIYEQPIDDLVSLTTLKTDLDGDGVFETIWTTADFQLQTDLGQFNQLASGEARPYTGIRAVGSKTFPYTWVLTHIDRVQVVGVFGWPAVPPAVHQASMLLAADYYKLREAPFGVAGFSEFGAVRVSANPAVADMLRPYLSPRRKVGV